VKVRVFILALFLAVLFPAISFAQDRVGDIVRFGSDIVVKKDETIAGNVVIFDGNAIVRGEIEGNLVVISGNANLSGKVGGDMVVIGGNTKLASTAVVEGNLVSFGGKVIREPGSRVVAGEVTGRGAFWRWLGKIPIFILKPVWWFSSLLTFLALAAIVVALLPEQTSILVKMAEAQFWRSLGIGLLGTFLVPFIIVVLIVSLIGILLIPLFLLLLAAAFIYGYIGISLWIGQRLLVAIKSDYVNQILAVLVGIFLLALIGLIPFMGSLIRSVAYIVGLGAVLISKFGTGKPWFKTRTTSLSSKE
jgi:hypothetical protein